MSGIIPRIRILVKTVTFQLVAVSMAVMLPISLIILGMSGYARRQMEEEVYLTKKSELELQMGRIDSDIQAMEERIQEELEGNFMRLNNYRSEEVISSLIYDVWKQLRSIRQQRENMNVAFLVTNWDHHVYITYDSIKYEYEEYCQIQEFLEESEFIPLQSKTYVTYQIADEDFFVYTKQYMNFTIGYLISQEDLLQSLGTEDTRQEEQFLLADPEGRLAVGGTLDLEKKRQQVMMDGVRTECYIIPYYSPYLNCSVVRAIPVDCFGGASSGSRSLFLLLVAAGFCAVPVMIGTIHHIIIKPMKKVTAGILAVRSGDLDYKMGDPGTTVEFQMVAGHFNQMTQEIRSLKIESYEKDIEKLEIEKLNLRLQLNPHLLLNSLNIIYSLAQAGKNTVISKYVVHLVEYFRYSIRKNDEMVTVESEIQFVRNFLEIQSIRFPDRFSFVYDIEDEVYDARIPALMIENFVENSVKYGMKDKEKMEISVSVKIRDSYLHISVCDTGNGIPVDRLEKLRRGELIEDEVGKHIGIWNCRKRLDMYYGDDTGLSISSVEGEGTQVWLKLPLQYGEDGKERSRKYEFTDCR